MSYEGINIDHSTSSPGNAQPNPSPREYKKNVYNSQPGDVPNKTSTHYSLLVYIGIGKAITRRILKALAPPALIKFFLYNSYTTYI
jgi:hypothetical protein